MAEVTLVNQLATVKRWATVVAVVASVVVGGSMGASALEKANTAPLAGSAGSTGATGTHAKRL